MGYIMLKNVETTSDEQIMRGVWGGGAAYLPSANERLLRNRTAEYQYCGKQAEPSDELRLSITLIFEPSDDT